MFANSNGLDLNNSKFTLKKFNSDDNRNVIDRLADRKPRLVKMRDMLLNYKKRFN